MTGQRQHSDRALHQPAAPYAAWQNYLWNQPVLPKAAWSKLSASRPGDERQPVPRQHRADELIASTTGSGQTRSLLPAQPQLVGPQPDGPVVLLQVPLRPVNGSNNVELSNLVSNNIDWSNNFLPGISSLIRA